MLNKISLDTQKKIIRIIKLKKLNIEVFANLEFSNELCFFHTTLGSSKPSIFVDRDFFYSKPPGCGITLQKYTRSRLYSVLNEYK